MKKPYIRGEWRVLFKPEVHGNYVNDHSIVKGSDGLWLIYGITSQLFGYFGFRIGKSSLFRGVQWGKWRNFTDYKAFCTRS